MDYLDIVEVESLEDAVDFLSDGCDPVGIVVELKLSGEGAMTVSALREAADLLDVTCCGFGEGVFRFKGDLWYVACDFGH